MMVGKDESRLVEKRDLVHVAILVAIALVIGVYLIATTVLIAKDGVFYIEQAQKLSTDPVAVIKAHPPGYPFLILIAHAFVALFANSSSVQGWIYSAQSVTLLCRLLALIPLYFMGKLLVGGKNSFWAILILIFLPFPTKVGCDTVREWPYLLFLATGFFFLLWNVGRGKLWPFSLVGLSSGLGYWIRPECAQLVVYGFIWLTMSVVWPKVEEMSRWKSLAALALLFIGFAFPTLPYLKCTGQVIPPKVKTIIKNYVSCNAPFDKARVTKEIAFSTNYNLAETVRPNALKAITEIFKTVGENLMWFFMPALLMGLWWYFQKEIQHKELFLIVAFIITNVAMMVLRYCYIQLHVSQRWSLPLITFTIFYIPVGLRIISRWLEHKFPLNKQKTKLFPQNKPSWFSVLFLIGICLCLPKLLQPIRMNKQGYRDVAKWLDVNTSVQDIVAVPDRRISFYAEREGRKHYWSPNVKYVVKRFKEGEEPPIQMKEVWYSFLNKKNKDKVVIYQKI